MIALAATKCADLLKNDLFLIVEGRLPSTFSQYLLVST